MTQDPSSSSLVSIGRAAKLLKVSIDTVRRWDNDGILNSIRSEGGHRLFRVSDLSEFKQNRPLKVSEAAEQLGISTSTLRRLEKQGKIKTERNEQGERRYARKSLEEYRQSIIDRAPVASQIPYAPPISGKTVTIPDDKEPSGYKRTIKTDVTTFADISQPADKKCVDNGKISESEPAKSWSLTPVFYIASFLIMAVLLGVGSARMFAVTQRGHTSDSQKGGVVVDKDEEGQVLALLRSELDRFFEVNVTTFFNDRVYIDGLLALSGEMIAEDVNVDLGSGTIYAANLVNSIQGAIGDVAFVGADGVEVVGLTIINTDRGSEQGIFKQFIAGQDIISVDNNEDSIIIAAGDNVTVKADPDTKTIMISSPSGTFTLAGDVGSSVIQQGDVLRVVGGTGLKSVVGPDRAVTVHLADTAVTPNSYGAVDSVATFTVDQQGRLTAAGSTDIHIDANRVISGMLPVIRGGTGTGTVFTPGSLVFAGASGVYGQNNASLFWDTVNSRLGVGTNTPTGGILHVVGQCVTGDTKLRRRRRRKGKNGEWIEDWEEVPIKDIKEGDHILSLNEDIGEFVPAKVNKLMDMGEQEVFLLVTEGGLMIETTGNHPYLTLKQEAEKQVSTVFEVDQSPRLEQSIDEDSFISIANKQQSFTLRVPKEIKKQLKVNYYERHPYGKFGFQVFAQLVALAARKSGLKITDLYIDEEYPGWERGMDAILANLLPAVSIRFARVGHVDSPARDAAYGAYVGTSEVKAVATMDELKRLNQKKTVAPYGALGLLNAVTGDSQDTQSIRTRYQSLPYLSSKSAKWSQVYDIKPGAVIATLHGWQKVVAVKPQGEKQTYDIEIEGTRNFIGNDIVAHNTYLGGDMEVTGTTTLNGLTYTWPGTQTADGLLTTDGAGNLTWGSISGSGGMESFDVSDGTDTETVADGQTLQILGGTGMLSTVSPTRTVTVTLDTSYTDGRYVNITGDTMTGALNLPSNGLAVGTNQLVVSGGNVGIGTTAPGSKLTVVNPGGNILTTEFQVSESSTSLGASRAYTASLVNTHPTDNNFVGFTFNKAAGFTASTATFGSIFTDRTNNYGDLFFSTRGIGNALSTPNLYINSTGNVGIGMTTPDAQLHINSKSATTKGLIVRNAFSQSANLTEWQNSVGTALSVVDKDGNVGIGTGSPGVKLDINGLLTGSLSGLSSPTALISDNVNSIAGVGMRNTNTGTGADFRFSISDTTDHYVAFNMPSVNNTSPNLFGLSRASTVFMFNTGGTARDMAIGPLVNKSLIFGTNNSERMRITGSGNVGIGTTTPDAQLQVHTSSASKVAQIIRGAESQSANLQEWQDSNGDVLGSFSGNSPFFEIGSNALTQNSELRVYDGNPGSLNWYAYIRSNASAGTTFGSTANRTVTVTSGGNGVLLLRTSGSGRVHLVGGNGTNDMVRITTGNGLAGLLVMTEHPGTIDPLKGAVILGTAPTKTSAETRLLTVPVGSGTDIEGSTLVLGGGIGTGTGDGGAIVFQTAAAGSAGSTLNALSERMRIDSNGNVGIGTASPDYLLHVVGDGVTSQNSGGAAIVRVDRTDGKIAALLAGGDISGFYFDTTGDFAIQRTSRAVLSGTSFGAASDFVIKGSNGRLGIGTASPGSKLSVSGSISAGLYSGTTAPTNGMIISGNVGIGTASPQAKFQVDGASGAPSTANSLMTLRNSVNNIGFQMGAESNRGWIRGVDVLVSATNWGALGLGNGFVNLGTSGSYNQVYLDTTSGNVGIGTDNPISRLNIRTGAAATRGLVIRGAALQSADLTQWQNSAGTVLNVVDSAGNVGIGIISPGSMLHVGAINDDVSDTKAIIVESRGFAGLELRGDRDNASGEPGGAFVRLSQDGGQVQGILGLVNSGGDGSGGSLPGATQNSMALVTKFSSSPLHLGAANSIRMTIESNGNVGIGTGPAGQGRAQDLLHVRAGGGVRLPVRVQTTSNTLGHATGISFKTNNSFLDDRYKGAIFFERTDTNGRGSLHFATTNTDDSGNAVLADARLTIVSNGNVGIGTMSPEEKLHVVGGIARIDNTGAGAAIVVNRTDGKAASLQTGTVSARFMFDETGDFEIMPRSAANVVAGAGSIGATKFRMLSTGEVGIGNNVTPESGARLVVMNGNVGIGTTGPTGKLEVVSPDFPVIKGVRTSSFTNETVAAIAVKHTTSGDMVDGFGASFSFIIEDSAGVENTLGGVGALRDGADNSGAIFFNTRTAGVNNERMRISSSGNVGIGMASPGSRLVVKGSGSTSATSALEVQNSSDASLLFVRNDGLITVGSAGSGTLSVPGAGANSEQFGAGATASDIWSLAVGYQASAVREGVAIGYQASTTNLRAVAVGYNSSAGDRGVALGRLSSASTLSVAIGSQVTSSVNSVVIGSGASSTVATTVAIGQNATISGNATNATVVGVGASVTNVASSTAIGRLAKVTGVQGTALGDDSSAGGSFSTALGRRANADHTNAIAIGVEALTTASNQLVVGSNARLIDQVYIGKGVTSANPGDITYNATGGSGTDIAGGALQFAGGRGTGTGAGGAIVFQTAAASGSSGSSLNSLTERMRIDSNGNVGIGTTSPSAQLQVHTSSASKVAQIIRGAASQIANIFEIQNSGANILVEVNANGVLTIGNSGNAFTFNPGSGMVLSGTARPTRQVTLSPEYPGAALSADGGNNAGVMRSDFCAASTGVGGVPARNTDVCNNDSNLHNYYQWTTTEATPQDYDIVVRWRVPDNFDGWASSNPVKVNAKRTDVTNNSVKIFMYDSSNAVETNANGVEMAGAANTWVQTNVSSLSGTYTPGSYVTIRIVLTADTNDSVEVGEISLDYLTNN